MKTLKLVTCIILFCACSSFAQTPPASPTPPATPSNPSQPTKSPGSAMQSPGQPMAPGQQGPRMSRYMVQIPHTKEQCQTVMNEIKEKGVPLMMRFDWGCNSGDHIGFAMIPGASEDAVRKQLPEGVQKMAKITKIEKYNPAQMEQMHK